jgi:hypothetical protein
MAFRNSSNDGGISVISSPCVIELTGNVCDHIRRYYPTVGGHPIIFWEFEENILPEGYSLEKETSDSGDVCHHNIKGVSDSQAGKIIKGLSVEEFSHCNNSHVIQFNPEILSR